MSAAAPSQATLAANLKQATDLAAKLKDQVAAREGAIKQAHDLLTKKAEEIEALHKQVQDGDAELHDLQDTISGHSASISEYASLLDAQQQQLQDVLAASS